MTIQELFARLGIAYPPAGRAGIPVEVLMAFLVAEVAA